MTPEFRQAIYKLDPEELVLSSASAAPNPAADTENKSQGDNTAGSSTSEPTNPSGNKVCLTCRC